MPLPVFFVSHGGPSFMYNETSPEAGDLGAFQKLTSIGKAVKAANTKFVVAISAHWQSQFPQMVEVSVPKSYTGSAPTYTDAHSRFGNDKVELELLENELIYDFYGFPEYMYQETFRTKGDIELSQDIVMFLKEHGITARLNKRGIDHGVWVPGKAMFTKNKGDSQWDIDVPVVQISLSADETDFKFHYKLGRVLSKLRDQGGLLLVSGMSVHNLRDMDLYHGSTAPYSAPFNQLIREAIDHSQTAEQKFENFQDMLRDPVKKQLLYQAHPTLEHFVPMLVGLGAASADNEHTSELYNNESSSLGWGIYKFGPCCKSGSRAKE